MMIHVPPLPLPFTHRFFRNIPRTQTNKYNGKGDIDSWFPNIPQKYRKEAKKKTSTPQDANSHVLSNIEETTAFTRVNLGLKPVNVDGWNHFRAHLQTVSRSCFLFQSAFKLEFGFGRNGIANPKAGHSAPCQSLTIQGLVNCELFGKLQSINGAIC